MLVEQKTIWQLSMWIFFSISLLSSFILVFTCIFSIVLSFNLTLNDNGNIWFAIWSLVISLRLCNLIFTIMTNVSEVIARSFNLERIVHYLEATFDSQILTIPYKPAKRKRTKIAVLFKDVYLTLGNILMLKNLNLSVKKGSKVALLGIEGVGRSYIFNVLMGKFQMDPNPGSSIEVMGSPWSIRGEQDGCIGVIDSAPILFEGTLRSNIDPYSKYSDEELISQLLSIFPEAGLLELLFAELIGEEDTRVPDSDALKKLESVYEGQSSPKRGSLFHSKEKDFVFTRSKMRKGNDLFEIKEVRRQLDDYQGVFQSMEECESMIEEQDEPTEFREHIMGETVQLPDSAPFKGISGCYEKKEEKSKPRIHRESSCSIQVKESGPITPKSANIARGDTQSNLSLYNLSRKSMKPQMSKKALKESEPTFKEFLKKALSGELEELNFNSEPKPICNIVLK
jgi:energy-coupling factor transporter ATP-binding protein EcfA2